MDHARRRKAEALFHKALEFPPEAVASILVMNGDEEPERNTPIDVLAPNVVAAIFVITGDESSMFMPTENVPPEATAVTLLRNAVVVEDMLL